ncbi:serine/threonine-protein kinase [Actinomadura violacea]|uniref:non-specific serine/threonine protein kinase n=1 Tax=Actinomadura violacea TaxID=2819934 RepID=A0ABS3RL60_9ACTN|nr:serine/threonine-protein kinase [Actinomadura violacea]MBO2457467.1 serine/threonine protein kinase [Actinomadura violacea]
MADDFGRVLLDRYRLVEPLGQGGMGTVWRAHDTRLDRDVAVKQLRLPPALDAEQQAAWTARLDREARAAARLRHPGIVTVYDLVTGEDGQPYIIMELVPGRSLADLLADHGTIPPQRAATLGLQILDALRTAHQAGIVHRDLKPANVLLDGERALLTDFGIAAVEGETVLTASGALLGTPAFMAPEQVQGQTTTAATDLWALGATLYTAVEGQPPFTGTSTGAVLIAVATQEPRPARAAGPLTPVVAALLSKEPAQRPDAGALHAMLTRIEAPAATTHLDTPPPHGLPTPPQYGAPPAPTHPIPASERRPRMPVVIAATAAVVLVLAGAGAWLTTTVRDNLVYRANKREAAALGAPAGFTFKQDRKGKSHQARRIYTGCPKLCSELETVVRDDVFTWLRTNKDVAAVNYPPGTPFTSQGRTIYPLYVKRRDGKHQMFVLLTVKHEPKQEYLLEVDAG